MPTKKADAIWTGSLTDGSGHVTSESGVLDADLGWQSRAETGPNTNPEELIGAAHAGCYSMALSHILAGAGHAPERLETHADVSFEKVGDGFGITGIKLSVVGRVPGLDAAEFERHAQKAKTDCPVSKALSATPVTLDAKLAG